MPTLLAWLADVKLYKKGVSKSERDIMKSNITYKSVENIGERDLICVPGLGYVPVMVKERRVLAEEAVKRIAVYTGGPVLNEVYVMAPDDGYLELLRKAGFTLEPDIIDDDLLMIPIVSSIYGDVQNRWRVVGRDFIAYYPPLGYYDSSRERIYVLDSVSNRIGVVVHENVHYATRKLGDEELSQVEEAVARFYEVLAEMDVEGPVVPLKELPQRLEDDKVVENLKFIVKALGVRGDIPLNKRNEALWLFREAVGLMEYGELDPRILHRIVRGDAYIESFGLVFRVVEC